MPSKNGNDGRGGPWSGGATCGSDIEDLVRQGQGRLKQIMPSGGPRGVIVVPWLISAVVTWVAAIVPPGRQGT